MRIKNSLASMFLWRHSNVSALAKIGSIVLKLSEFPERWGVLKKVPSAVLEISG